MPVEEMAPTRVRRALHRAPFYSTWWEAPSPVGPSSGGTAMNIGLSIPRSPDPDGLRRFAQRAEQLGFESVLAGDHIVLPTGGTTQYPYTATGAFSSPAAELCRRGYRLACGGHRRRVRRGRSAA